MPSNDYDLIVIGMGLSGLMAAMTAAEAGKRVLIIGKGMGRLCLFSNSIDFLGTLEGDHMADGISAWIAGHPEHPYAKAGQDRITRGISMFRSLFIPPYTFCAPGAGNCFIPTGAGTYRPTYLVPSTMTSGVGSAEGALIAGVEHFKDFSALQAAGGLNARGATIPLGRPRDRDFTPMALARLIEKPWFRTALGREIKRRMEGEKRVGFPAVLGLRNPAQVREELEYIVGAEVFEIPILPPSIPGIRIFNRFKAWFDQGKATFLLGPSVKNPVVKGGRCEGVNVLNPPVSRLCTADAYVLATGRFLSGGLVASRESISEPLFGLPVVQPRSREEWFGKSFFDGHPVNHAGIRVDEHFRPIDDQGRVVLENVRIAGSILAYHNSIEEKSRDGIPLSTGYAAAREAIES